MASSTTITTTTSPQALAEHQAILAGGQGEPLVGNAKPPLIALAAELQYRIFANLRLGEIPKLALTCRELHELTKVDYLWQSLYKNRFPKQETVEGIDKPKRPEISARSFLMEYKNPIIVAPNLQKGRYISHTFTESQWYAPLKAEAEGRASLNSVDERFNGRNLKTSVACSLTNTDIDQGCTSLAVAGDGKVIKSFEDGTIEVVDLEANQNLRVTIGEENWAQLLATALGQKNCVQSFPVADSRSLMIAHGDLLMTCAVDDFGIHIWSVESGELLHTLAEHTKSIFFLGIVNNKLISGSKDNTVKIWDLKKKTCEHTHQCIICFLCCLTTHEDKLFMGYTDGSIDIWDLTTQSYKADIIPEQRSAVYSLSFEDGVLYSGHNNKTIRACDFSVGESYVLEEIAHLFKGQADQIHEAKFRFSMMHRATKNGVYKELRKILKLRDLASARKAFSNCFEHSVFNSAGRVSLTGKHSVSHSDSVLAESVSGPSLNAKAIENYLKRRIRRSYRGVK